jgi:hypothetical protein
MTNSLWQHRVLSVLPSRVEQWVGVAETFKRLGADSPTTAQRFEDTTGARSMFMRTGQVLPPSSSFRDCA